MPQCAFCQPEVRTREAIATSENFYVIPTIGQISDGGHVLIISNAHLPCLGALEKSFFHELIDFKDKVQSAVRKEYGTTICFEHGIIGQSVPHAHLQILPSTCDLFQTLKMKYPFYFEMDNLDDLGKVYDERRVYLFYENQQSTKYAFIMDAIPQYLRLVAAEQMGRTPRGDWRAWRSDSVCAERDDEFMVETSRRLKRVLNA